MPLADIDISDSLQRGFNEFFAWLPELVGALLILIVGWFVAKLVGGAIWRALRGANFDRTVQGGPGGPFVGKVTDSPSLLLGKIAKWAVFLSAISLAVSVLGINALTSFMGEVWDYLPNVIVAILIFLVAGAVSAAVAALATRAMGDTPIGKIVATAAPILVMTIATFMILTQLQIAKEIVLITYAGLIGAIALGSALAFGLGGREVASQMLRGAYDTAQENKEQAKEDLKQGMERAKEDVKGQTDGGSGSEEENRTLIQTHVQSGGSPS